MRRRLIIILVAMAVLIVPVIIAAVILKRSPTLQNTVLRLANVPGSTNATNTAANGNTNTAAAGQIVDKTQIIFVSRNFTELYGSGSNQNNFQNITDAEKWTTQSFANYLNTSLVQQRATLQATPYHDIITTTLVTTVTRQTSTVAAVTVSTQRQETIDRQTKTYYQDILLDLLKVGNDWRVNAAAWRPL